MGSDQCQSSQMHTECTNKIHKCAQSNAQIYSIYERCHYHRTPLFADFGPVASQVALLYRRQARGEGRGAADWLKKNAFMEFGSRQTSLKNPHKCEAICKQM